VRGNIDEYGKPEKEWTSIIGAIAPEAVNPGWKVAIKASGLTVE
jgi:hypothetical protein